MKRKIFVALLVLALALSACGGNSKLERKRAQWDAQGVTHYRFQLTISCFCAFRNLTPVAVEVQDEQILSMLDVNGEPLSEDFRSTFEEAATMEGLFALTGEALKDADQVTIAYDATFGFPSSVEIDWIELALDDEISYYVAEFEALK